MATSAPTGHRCRAQAGWGIHFYYPPLDELLPALCRPAVNKAGGGLGPGRHAARRHRFTHHISERVSNVFDLLEQLF
jgi:hypothetical protein